MSNDQCGTLTCLNTSTEEQVGLSLIEQLENGINITEMMLTRFAKDNRDHTGNKKIIGSRHKDHGLHLDDMAELPVYANDKTAPFMASSVISALIGTIGC